MNVLIVGSGAREHAIAMALQRSPRKPRLFCCGTHRNPGITALTDQYWLGDINDVTAVTQLAKTWQVGMAIIGPEAPLEQGLADLLWQAAIPTIGPKKSLARIETSKTFARELMHKHHIPGLPRYQTFTDFKNAQTFLSELGEGNYVIKADGLMGGKGVKVAGDHLASFKEAMAYCQELTQLGQSFIIEEKLIGQEFSLMCFCDGEHMVFMPVVQDHKRAFENDKGPNTGGMGSYSDHNRSLPFLTDDDVNTAKYINQSVIQALSQDMQERYVGILYGSFIATAKGIYVIEFNARFGDPEALNVLTILESDFVDICQSMAVGNLSSDQVQFSSQATVCKYVVPQGYPEQPQKDAVIDVTAVKDKSRLYFAAVHATDGAIKTSGSRTAAYVGVADTIYAAENISEKEIKGIVGPLYHRPDIGTEKLIQTRIDAMRRLRSE